MKQIRRHQIGISILLTVLFSIFSLGCSRTGWYGMSKHGIARLKDKPLDIVLFDNRQQSNAPQAVTRAWSMEVQAVNEQSLTGTFRLLPKEKIENIRNVKGNKGEWQREYHILMQINKEYAQTMPDTLTASIAMDQVKRAEIYDYKRFGKYSWQNKSITQIINLTDKPLDIYLVDASQPKKRAWAVEAGSMDKQKLTGAIRLLSKKEVDGIRRIGVSKTERLSQYHIILSLKKEYANTLPDSLNAVIPLNMVETMEIYEYNRAATVVSVVLISIGAAAAVFGVVVVVALAAKGQSCPFIYADNPGGQVFEGEIYSGATYPQLERHDWLPMPHLQPTGDTYRLAIANKVHEIQYTNQLELLAVDHPLSALVQFDKYGRLHTMSDLEAPVTATALDGQDIREQILREDSLRYLGAPDNTTPDASDGLVLQFARPSGARQAKLVVNAKNSMWMDYAHGLMLDEFGEYAGKIRENFRQKSAEDLQKWMLRQNLPLSVLLETAPGQWERADYFNLAGPMALKRDVLPLDISKIKGDQVRIKLSSGFMFWEIDYVGIDFSPDQDVQVQALSPISAVDQNGIDRTAALRADDTIYYDQPNVGDEALVTFSAPPLYPGVKRSLLLHAKGHYQILREQAPGKPSPRYLKQFAKPNAFPRFAREQWRSLKRDNNLVFEKTLQPN